ncbi:Phage portal protein [compost metagenome]
MAVTYLQNLGNALLGRNNPQNIQNYFNQALYAFFGSKFTSYDPKGITYLEKGYNLNSTVYAIISQASTKVTEVPTYLKKVENKKYKRELDSLLRKNGILQPSEQAKKRILETKAYQEQEIQEPLSRPNYYQTWPEFYALWETFMMLNGNAYIYMMMPEEGANAGRPLQVFLLPSHYVDIVLKETNKAEFSLESPIDYYCLILGNIYIEFPADTIIHTKYPNPNYDLNGAQLYGQAPLRAALNELNINNSAVAQNIKTMQNGGVYGFIHGTDAKEPLTSEQVLALKDTLVEMERDNAVLNRFKGSSVPIGFTKLSLNTDELQPFEFLKYSATEICNVFGWPTGLLSINGEPKYDNMDIQWRMALSNRIKPDLCILAESLNTQFYPRFRETQNVVKIFDVSEMPEMQQDMSKMSEWLRDALDRGIITPDEYRSALKYPETGLAEMQTHIIKQGYVPLIDIMITDEPILNDNKL